MFTVLLLVGFELTMCSAGWLLHEGQAGDKQVVEVREAKKQDLYTLTLVLPGITGDRANGLCWRLCCHNNVMSYSSSRDGKRNHPRFILAHSTQNGLWCHSGIHSGITSCISWEDELGRINICLLAYQIRGQRWRFGNMEKGHGVMWLRSTCYI